MAFSKNSATDDVMSEINVTPLVDVMLVLLIVFMITMPVLTHSIDIALPQSSTTIKDSAPKEPLRVSIDKNGEYYIGDNKITQTDLSNAFTQAKQQNPNVVLAIDGDKAVAYDSVVQLLNIAKEADIQKIGFVSETVQ